MNRPSTDTATNAYILNRYFADLPPTKLQRSQSLPVLLSDCKHVESLENPSVLVSMALDILHFRNAALNINSIFREFIADMNAFSTCPADAYRNMSAIQHNWAEWSQYLLTVEMEIKRMRVKYKQYAKDEDWHDTREQEVQVNVEEASIDKLAFISSSRLQEMRQTLYAEDISRTHSPLTDSAKKLSLKKTTVAKEKRKMLETRANVAVSEESLTTSTILAPEIQEKIISLSSSKHSSDTIPIETCLQEKKTKDTTTVCKEADGLDLISDDSLDEFSLNLSSNSEKCTKTSKKTVHCIEGECYVKISKKEKLLVDEAVRRRQQAVEQSDTDTKPTTSSTSSSSSSHLPPKRKHRKRIIKSDSSDSSHSERRLQTPPPTRTPRKRIIESSSDAPSESSDDVMNSNSDASATQSAYSSSSPSPPSSSLHSYQRYNRESDDSESMHFHNDPLDLISDSDPSDESSDVDTKQKNMSKKKQKQLSRQKDDPKAVWRKNALLTAALDNNNQRPMLMSDSSDESVEFVSAKREESPIKNGETLSPRNFSQQGRKNIKQIMSNKDLQQATVDAANAEKQRIERLKERYSQLAMQESQTSELAAEDSFVLDASDELTIIVDPNLTKRMKNHQRHGVQFMWDNCFESLERLRKDDGSGCILAHCMGLGKTFQVIALLHTLFKYPPTKMRTAAIICPLTTIQNWKSEFRSAVQLAKSGPDIKIYCISGSNRTQDWTHSTIRAWQRSGGVLVMAYETFTRTVVKHEMLKPALIDPGPDLIVCDEGHLLKSGQTHRTKTISSVRTKRRIVLTGTPMQNNLEEYYYMCSFVKPAFLGTYKEFRNRFINPITNGQYGNSGEMDIKLMKKRSHVLHKMTKGFIQRYEVSELHQYLPSMHHYVLKIDLHPLQIKLYKTYIDLCKSHLKKLFANYNVLKLIWTHPRLLQQAVESLRNKPPAKKMRRDDADADDVVFLGDAPIAPDWWKSDIPQEALTELQFGRKFIVLMNILQQCLANGEKLLVFTSSIQALNALELFIAKAYPSWRPEQHYFRMDGSVPYERRKRYCSIFNQPGNNVMLFLLTHKVGGLGLNLAGANRVVIMDVSWNPTHDTQSISRIYRLGQTKPCYVYRLVAKDTMEEVMFERSVTKQAIAGRVVDELQIHRHFTAAQLCLMYRCTFDTATVRPLPKLPADHLLATLLKTYTFIFTYEDHRELMQNLPDEKLDEDEMRLAWEEYENEKVGKVNGAGGNTVGFGFISNVVGGVDESNLIASTSTSMQCGSICTITRPPRDRNSSRYVLLAEGKQNNLQLMFDENGKMIPLLDSTKKMNGITDAQLRAAQDFYTNQINQPNTSMLPGVYLMDSLGLLKDYRQGVFESNVVKTSQPHISRNSLADDKDDDIVWVNPEETSNSLIILD